MSAYRSMHLLHSVMSIACSSALSHDVSRPLKSFLAVSVQFFRGFPLLFRPSGTQCNNIWLALLCLSMRLMWPSHRSFLFLMMFSLSSCPVLSLILLFVILSFSDTCKILLCHASSLFLFSTVIGQVSDPYNSVFTTLSHYFYSINSFLILLVLSPLLLLRSKHHPAHDSCLTPVTLNMMLSVKFWKGIR